MEFISFLSLAQLSQATIAAYMSGVRHHLRVNQLPTFIDNFSLKLALRGTANLHASVDTRIPITLDILQRMIAGLNKVLNSSYDITLYTALLSAGFFGLLRPGEMVKSDHALSVHNVYFNRDKVVCFLPTSKAHRGPVPQVVQLDRQNSSACPVSAMTNYSKIRSPMAGQFFIKVDGTPVTSSDFSLLLSRLAQFLGLPSHQVKPHSLRIGGSTHLHLSGVPVSTIKERGRWSSNAFKRYIRPDYFCSPQEDLVYRRQAHVTGFPIPDQTSVQVHPAPRI